MEKELKELYKMILKQGLTKDPLDIEDLIEKLRKRKKQKELHDLFKKLHVNDILGSLSDNLKKLGDLEDFYKNLKKLGFLSELKLNEKIQEGLNKEQIIKQLHKHAHILAPIIERLQETVETVSIPLNIPTKNDVANVAKLTKQNEEKIDSIEEQLKVLNQHLKQLLSEEVPVYEEAPAKKQKEDEKLSSKELKKYMLLQYILQTSSELLKRKE